MAKKFSRIGANVQTPEADPRACPERSEEVAYNDGTKMG
jgi:hypothetical protein